MKQFQLFKINNLPITFDFSVFLFPIFYSIFTGNIVQSFIFWSIILVSLFVHEYSHTLVALKRGYNVMGIHFFALGGMAKIGESYKNIEDHPKDHIAIAFAGPLSNIAIAIITLSVVLTFPALEFYSIMAVAINLVLGIFNLLPIFPLDGGRIANGLICLYEDDILKSRQYTNYVSAATGILATALFVYLHAWLGVLIVGLFTFQAFRDMKKCYDLRY